MADDAKILIDKTTVSGYITGLQRLEQSQKILKAMWKITVMAGDSNFDIGMIEFRYSDVKILLKCDNLERRLLIKGKIFIKTINSEDTQEFQELFEEGESRLMFLVQLKEKQSYRQKSDVTCELEFYASPENYFYFKCEDNFLPLRSDVKKCRKEILRKYQKDMLTLYQEGHFSDVTLRCESETFKVHKCVLSARSKAFAAIFQKPKKESESDVVEIKDISPDTLQTLLKYIYLYEVPTFNDASPYDLLEAAEMYNLPKLKDFSVLELQSTLSVDNVLRTLSYADLYDKGLKEISVKYICKEFHHIKNTQDWKTFEKVNNILATEVLENFTKFVNSTVTR